MLALDLEEEAEVGLVVEVVQVEGIGELAESTIFGVVTSRSRSR